MASLPTLRQRRGAVNPHRRRGIAAELCSSAIAVFVLVVLLAGIFRFATGQSPWPLFIVVELPAATVAFALLTLTSPR
jgi:hypothetical protein